MSGGNARGVAAPPDRWARVAGREVANIAVSVTGSAVVLSAQSIELPARFVEWSFHPGYALYVADVLASHARYALSHPARHNEVERDGG